MSADPGIDALRERATVASLAGFPFLLVFGIAWIVAGAATYALPTALAPWSYIAVGAIGTPLAIVLERRLGYLPPADPDPLLPLALQLMFVQIVAFPAILLVWNATPQYVPVAFAAIVGAHFLPYEWLYRTAIFRVLAIAVAVGPFVLAVVAGSKALHWTGFFVGPVLLAGAVAVRGHARRTWERSALRVPSGVPG